MKKGQILKKLLQNAKGQLKILPFHSNRAKNFCAIFFFSFLSTKKTEEIKILCGRNEILWEK